MNGLWLLISLAYGQTADEIIEKARQTQRVDNGIQQMKMVLVSRNGATRERQ